MAGSKTNGFETSILNHIFTNADIANIGDATGLRGSTTAGSLYIALFTVAPSDSAAGTECAYTSYARVAVARDGSNWTVSGNQASNTNAVTFPEATGGSETAVAAGIMTASTSGTLLFWCDISPTIPISTGSIPEIAAAGLTITED